MGLPIFWSPGAKNDYIIILDYLNTNWGQREALNFITRTESTLQLISANPRLFVSSTKKPGIHRCVLNRQISLFYRINNQNIELLRFWDNRMDPEKLMY
jgi:plasmid stabilization system protein ParE